MSAIEPTREQIAGLAALPQDEPVVMVNLLRFSPEGGEEHYMQYGREVAPHLERVGGRVLHAGSALTQVIGPDAKPWWDAILVVEYPTPGAFLDMVSNEEYAEILKHRSAALDRGDLIATSDWQPADQANR